MRNVRIPPVPSSEVIAGSRSCALVRLLPDCTAPRRMHHGQVRRDGYTASYPRRRRRPRSWLRTPAERLSARQPRPRVVGRPVASTSAGLYQSDAPSRLGASPRLLSPLRRSLRSRHRTPPINGFRAPGPFCSCASFCDIASVPATTAAHSALPLFAPARLSTRFDYGSNYQRSVCASEPYEIAPFGPHVAPLTTNWHQRRRGLPVSTARWPVPLPGFELLERVSRSPC
jgi:hypothetical protein